MSDEERPAPGSETVADAAMERIHRDRLPGEMESAMESGSDDGDISATERFEGEMTPEEALEVLAPAKRTP